MLIVTHATDPSPELNKDGTGLELEGCSTALGVGIRTTSDRDLSISQTLKLEVRGYKSMKIPSLSLVQTVLQSTWGDHAFTGVWTRRQTQTTYKRLYAVLSNATPRDRNGLSW